MISVKPNFNRPFVFLSVATSLDGQIASINGDTLLSNSKDWIRVHQLRAECDAIMVGSGTIKADDSKLTVDEELIRQTIKNHPIRVVVTSKGNIPLNSRVITYKPDILTIIATTSQCPRIQKQKLENRGCVVLECGNGPLTNLHHLLNVLKTHYHVERLMVEGGSVLNGELLNQKLIDEVHLAIAPVICGNGVPFFTLPNELPEFSKSPFFEILDLSQIDDMIWLRMSVHYQPRQIQ